MDCDSAWNPAEIMKEIDDVARKRKEELGPDAPVVCAVFTKVEKTLSIANESKVRVAATVIDTAESTQQSEAALSHVLVFASRGIGSLRQEKSVSES